MNNIKKNKNPNFFTAVFQLKCPHCRDGNMFQDKGSYRLKTFMKMNEHCPVCGQQTEIEQGFYYGTGYVSYALTVAFSVSTFVAWWVLIGVSFSDNRVFWWLGINSVMLLILQPWLMRLSRAIYLYFFVRYDEDYETSEPQTFDY